MLTRRRGERGSVLFLLPALALVVLVLAAIAVDLGLLHVRSRELWGIADGAANDAASAGLDRAALRGTGEVRLDPGLAEAAAAASVEAAAVDGVRIVAVTVGADAREVTVVLERRVEPVVGRGLPGAGARTLTATATARLVDPG